MQQRLQDKAYELWEMAGSPNGGEQHFWFQAKVEIAREEAKLDRELADSFPASDPPSSSVIIGATGDLGPDAAEIKPAPISPTQISPTQIRHSSPAARGWRRRLRAWWLYPAKE